MNSAMCPPYQPYQKAPSFTFKLPLRLVEAVFGCGNFDDCGDWLQDWMAEYLAEHPPSRSGYRLMLDCDFETVHPNPWFHTLNYTAQLPDERLARLLEQALRGKGLLD
ncbi:hypothetical protein [Comamonas resistens]|uniref:CdiI immunity protein domain-containing protein n=1 Tax=Comamonas resistens TaxID=3046670 RepID=A0ABY8SQ42_9BURK|nr:hypothetical protein [Comamonas resistens]MDL5035630.1 hypothetical protein [Comamonas resistens]WHS65048.1 hypothetical protein QMY55_21590 [Comamonas resistens]